MSNRQKFENDLTYLLSRLTSDVAPEVENKLNMLKDWLIKKKRKRCKNQPLRNGAGLRKIPHPKRLRNTT